MSGTIFSGTYSTGITLSSPSTQDPATIATTGRIDLTGTQGNGIYGTTAAAWVVGNYGTIIAPTRGIFLISGGIVTNFSTGLISGGYRGVEIDGGVGTLINTGSILGTKQQGVKLGGGGDVTNMSGGMITGASTYAAVYILNGGIVSNASGGSINGAVQFDAGAGTLLNAGAINTARSASTGVVLLSGGLVSNLAGGTIAGSVAGVYELAGGTVINAGSIRSRYAITSHTGGIVTNLAGGILTGTLSAVVFQEAAGTVTNAGAITLSGTGVVLGAGGILTNEGGAVINATSVGVRVVGGNVLNAGVIYGGLRYAAFVGGGATITNLAGGLLSTEGSDSIEIFGAGTALNAGSMNGGVGIEGDGTFINQAGGTVTGLGGRVISAEKLSLGLGGVTVVNYGVLQSGSIVLDEPSFISNAASGVIQGSVSFGYGAALHNAGSIGGSVALRYGYVTNMMGATVGTVTATFGPTTVTNAGTMGGITLAGGAITNESGGTISGVINVNTGYTSLVDSGLVNGFVNLNGGASISVATGATITGHILISYDMIGANLSNAGKIGPVDLNAGGAVTNSLGGSIVSGSYGVTIRALEPTADVVNHGLILGNIGVAIYGGVVSSTVVNSGTITGTGGTAVNFGTIANKPVVNDLLVAEPGAVFNGEVIGGAGANTVELTAGTGGPGLLTGFGSSIVNFDNITFDTGAEWTIAGSPAGFGGPISGFAHGDTIDLIGLRETVDDYSGGTLTLVGDQTIALDLPGSFTKASFQTGPDNATGTNVFLVQCFAAGTRLVTPTGDRAVEQLRPGDEILVASAELREIVWIGQRDVDCTHHPQPRKVWPVRVSWGAFGPGRPHADLWLSPDHAVYVEGVLIPVKHLINGSTIVQVPTERVTYYHIELPQHDVVLAEGLPVESFLDMRDGSNYANRPGPVRLYPDHAARVWEAFGCARLVVAGPELVAARALVARFAKDQAAA